MRVTKTKQERGRPHEIRGRPQIVSFPTKDDHGSGQRRVLALDCLDEVADALGRDVILLDGAGTGDGDVPAPAKLVVEDGLVVVGGTLAVGLLGDLFGGGTVGREGGELDALLLQDLAGGGVDLKEGRIAVGGEAQRRSRGTL